MWLCFFGLLSHILPPQSSILPYLLKTDTNIEYILQITKCFAEYLYKITIPVKIRLLYRQQDFQSFSDYFCSILHFSIPLRHERRIAEVLPKMAVGKS